MTCEEGCPDGLLEPDRTAMADKFPSIRFDQDTDTRRVTLLVKSEDFRPRKIVQTLRPGSNRVSCDLEQRVPG